MIRTILLIIVTLSIAMHSKSHGQYQQGDLAIFARDALARSRMSFTGPTFTRRTKSDGRSVLRYNLGYLEFFEPEPDDNLLLGPLTEQFRVEAARRSRDPVLRDPWWPETLLQVETEIQKMLSVLQNTHAANFQKEHELAKINDRIERLYFDAASRSAKAQGLHEAEKELHIRRAVAVALSTNPSNGTIYYIPAGMWDLYKSARRRGRDVSPPTWRTAGAMASVPLTGHYWFYVVWPLHKPLKLNGTVEITGPCSIEFFPDTFRVTAYDD